MVRSLVLATAAISVAADCDVDENYVYNGFDVGGEEASDAAECCELCERNENCKFYSFKAWDTTASYCFFKSSKANRSANTNYVSGAPGAPCQFDAGFDYYGGGIGGGKAEDAKACCSMCAAEPKCAFFTFSTDEKFCHFKSSNGDRRPNLKRISGSRPGGPPPPGGDPDWKNSCTADLKGGDRLSYPFCDASLSIQDRVADLLSRMTYEEKANALWNYHPALPRLGVPTMESGESTHGILSGCVGSMNSTGCPTSLPSGNGLGAAFDKQLYREVGDVIGTEARALNNQNGKSKLYLFDPNINLQRDPRWGRSQEIPGECPHLTKEYAVHLTTATQELEGSGLDERYARVGLTLKHWTMYDLEGYLPRTNPTAGAPNSSYCETEVGCERWNFVAWPPSKDFVEYYMAYWEEVVKRAKPASIMCSYNSAYGEPTCANDEMNNRLLRETWGWDGFFASDCTALELLQNTKWDHCNSGDSTCAPEIFPGGHNYTFTPGDTCHETLVTGGIDYNCGALYNVHLYAALESGHVTKADIDLAASRVYSLSFRLGMFDPLDGQGYVSIPASAVDSAHSRAIALRAAEESMVLLKNDDGTLPLKSGKIAFIGPHANSTQELLSNYHGRNTLVDSHSPLMAAEALAASNGEISVSYARGCNICDVEVEHNTKCPRAVDESMIPAAVAAAKAADTAVLFLGLDQSWEAEGFDRDHLLLPGAQEKLLTAVLEVQPRTVVVLIHGGPIAGDWMKGEHTVPAILDAFYPGELGGDAIVNTLFGYNNPAGRLPYTMYDNSIVAQRDIRDTDLRNNGGITYWWFDGTPLFPFAYGLSYTKFAFEANSDNGNLNIQELVAAASADLSHVAVRYSIKVTNIGERVGDCVVTAFLNRMESSPKDAPLRKLVAFERLRDVQQSSSHSVELSVTLRDLTVVDEKGRRVLRPGSFDVELGDGQSSLASAVKLVGSEVELERNDWAQVMFQKPEHSRAPTTGDLVV